MIEFYNSLTSETKLILEVFSIVLITSLLGFISRKIILKLQDKAAKTQNPWDDAILYAIRRPLRILIWVYGLSLAATRAFHEMEIEIVDFVERLAQVAFIFAISWALLRLTSRFEENYNSSSRRKKLDKTTMSAVSKLVRVSIIITSILIILQNLGFSISGVLAFGGIGGFAVGYAAKDLLSNFFGAIIVYLDKPFKVGDWIKSPEKEIEGVVENIGWRQTVIRKFDKRPLYVPNSIFNSVIIENPSRMTNRRIYEHFGVRYGDVNNVPKITKQVEDMLKKHKEIDTSQILMVYLDRFSDSSVDFFVYTFTKTTEWQKYHEIRHDVLLKISDIIDKNNSEFAFPSRTLHIAEAPPFLKEVKK
jgi:MscS family membrane protein